MEPINQEVDIFLRVLLIISTELFIDLSKRILKSLRHHNLFRIPNLLHQATKGTHQLPFMAKSVLDI